ncbi:MAG: RdgB/HAM1 family non-canonical purine NTP pyrophosphatase [Oscillospiraceae bacterium]
MRFILASNNQGKLRELKAILSDMNVELVSQSEAGLQFEAEETGTSFEENASIKARAACEALREPAIADDSGLVVDALNGEPGIFSARYGGNSCTNDAERTALLLKNMAGKTERSARFVSCIACHFPNGDSITARGECEGSITAAPQGTHGFGYDPVFEVSGTGKTMAELLDEEKNAISHRGAALKNFEIKLRTYYADK